MTFGTNDWWPKICIGKAGRSPLFPNTNLANINILIGISIFVNKPPQNLVFELGARIQINTVYEYNSVYIMHT